MSAAIDLLAELHSRGGRVRVDGSTLYVSPKSALSPDLVERLRQAKPEVLELLRAAPADMALGEPARPSGAPLSTRGCEALGGDLSEPAEYACASSSEERRTLLHRFTIDAAIPFATFDSPTVGAFLVVRDRRALEALDVGHAALPVLYLDELERSTGKLGAAGLQALLAARSAFGPGVELRAVRGGQRDG